MKSGAPLLGLAKSIYYSTRISSPEVVAGSVGTALGWVVESLVLVNVIGCLRTADELNAGDEIIIEDSKINIFIDQMIVWVSEVMKRTDISHWCFESLQCCIADCLVQLVEYWSTVREVVGSNKTPAGQTNNRGESAAFTMTFANG